MDRIAAIDYGDFARMHNEQLPFDGSISAGVLSAMAKRLRNMPPLMAIL